MTAAHDGRTRAEQMHADAYFQKPVDFEVLLGAVRAHAR
jgi:DNA-binding response OmpR family regulator